MNVTICKNCGAQNDDAAFFCFKCGANIKQPQPSPAGVGNCPKCGSAMHAGFIVERESPLSLYTYGSGVYWTPDEGGPIGGRVALKAYACPQCGYIEHYVRYLDKDREIVLRAPTRFRE